MESFETVTAENSRVFWQNGGEDGVPEAAILVEGYSDIMSLQQGKNSININYESLEALIKTMRTVKSLKK